MRLQRGLMNSDVSIMYQCDEGKLKRHMWRTYREHPSLVSARSEGDIVNGQRVGGRSSTSGV